MVVDLSTTGTAALPMALAALHRELDTGDRCVLQLPQSINDETAGDLVVGGGFLPAGSEGAVERAWTLPDTVGPDMRVLIVGLNPSPSSADTGVGFARPGNRFWPAVIAAGLATIDRDPNAALTDHGMGMTDVVKRTTRRAAELTPAEFELGLARVNRLAARCQPQAVAFVGLAGWRSVRNRQANAGWQDDALGGRPVYLLPSTSGLNASSQLPDFIEHFARLTEPYC